MLNNTGFDLGADGYDNGVGLSDENDRYPFAGYRAMMNALYQRVLAQSGHDVLDIGFGTGILTSRLYEQGCRIYGQDFAAQMLRLCLDQSMFDLHIRTQSTKSFDMLVNGTAADITATGKCHFRMLVFT